LLFFYQFFLLLCWKGEELVVDFIVPRYPEVKNGDGAFFITGCSSGIGKSSVLDLLRHDFTVYANVRSQKDADNLIIASKNNSKLIPLIGDVTNSNDIDKFLSTISNRNSIVPLRGIVNNAGVGYNCPVQYCDLKKVRQLFDINFFAAVEVSQKFLPLILKNKGRFVHIGSLQGENALPFGFSYGASKFALRSFSDTLRRENKPFGVTSSIVEPGYVTTEMSGKSTAPEVLKMLDEDGKRRFGFHFDLARVQEKRAEIGALSQSTDTTDYTIRHALTSSHPRTRYVMNWHALLTRLGWFFPDALNDFFVDIIVFGFNKKTEL